MDHLDAEKMGVVERYVLGDLSVSEVEEFERHFFDCPQCSEELRALTMFQENARAVFAEQDPAPRAVPVQVPQSTGREVRTGFSPLSFMRAAMVLGALVIGVFAGYMAFSPRESAQPVSEFPLYAQSRGQETVVSPAAGSQYFTLYWDRTWDGEYPAYRAVLRDAAGADKFTLPLAPGAPGDAIHVLIPTHKLAAGKYVLVMFGGDTELARFPFTLQFK
jgi:hypothetical protein